jgi:hypothetical protein
VLHCYRWLTLLVLLKALLSLLHRNGAGDDLSSSANSYTFFNVTVFLPNYNRSYLEHGDDYSEKGVFTTAASRLIVHCEMHDVVLTLVSAPRH